MYAAKVLTIGHRQAGVVHRRQLRAEGVPRAAVARMEAGGLLRAVGSGALVLPDVRASWHQCLWLGVLTAQRRSAVSHRSAARLHGIGSFGERHVDVIQIGPAPHLTVGSHPHRTTLCPPHHVTEVQGIAVTTVERTLFDLAGLVSIKRLGRGWPSLPLGVVARTLDDALASGVSRSRIEAVFDELAGRGRGGTVVMRGLLEERGEGFVATESQLEDLLVEVLERFGLPRPTRQRSIGGTVAPVGRVDFLFAPERVVIEADGRRNHTALLDREHDAWRDLELAASGFRVVRVTWGQLRTDPVRFARGLRLILTSAAA